MLNETTLACCITLPKRCCAAQRWRAAWSGSKNQAQRLHETHQRATQQMLKFRADTVDDPQKSHMPAQARMVREWVWRGCLTNTHHAQKGVDTPSTVAKKPITAKVPPSMSWPPETKTVVAVSVPWPNTNLCAWTKAVSTNGPSFCSAQPSPSKKEHNSAGLAARKKRCFWSRSAIRLPRIAHEPHVG